MKFLLFLPDFIRKLNETTNFITNDLYQISRKAFRCFSGYCKWRDRRVGRVGLEYMTDEIFATFLFEHAKSFLLLPQGVGTRTNLSNNSVPNIYIRHNETTEKIHIGGVYVVPRGTLFS